MDLGILYLPYLPNPLLVSAWNRIDRELHYFPDKRSITDGWVISIFSIFVAAINWYSLSLINRSISFKAWHPQFGPVHTSGHLSIQWKVPTDGLSSLGAGRTVYYPAPSFKDFDYPSLELYFYELFVDAPAWIMDGRNISFSFWTAILFSILPGRVIFYYLLSSFHDRLDKSLAGSFVLVFFFSFLTSHGLVLFSEVVTSYFTIWTTSYILGLSEGVSFPRSFYFC